MRTFESACHLHGSTMLASVQAVGKKTYHSMILVHEKDCHLCSTLVGSDAGEAPGGVEGDKSRESAGRKHARQNPLVAMQRESLCSHWHSRRNRSRKLLLAVGRDAGDR